MFRSLALAAMLMCPIVGLCAVAQDREEEKEKPKDKGKKEKGKKGAPLPGFPDFDKVVPPNATPEQREQMRKMYDKMKEQMQKSGRGGFPGMPGMPGGGFPGGAFPGGGFPGGAFPGGRGPGFPGGGFPGGAMPGMPPGMRFAMTSPRLGVAVEPVTATLSDQLDLPAKQGIVITDMRKDSPADKAGLKNHDILVELDGKPVPSRVDGLYKALTEIKADEKVQAVVVRKGKKVTIRELTLPEGQALGPPAFGGVRPGGGFAPPTTPLPPGGGARKRPE